METQDIRFITDPDEDPPSDYIVKVVEDAYVDMVVASLWMADAFSQGPPFEVSILRGKNYYSGSVFSYKLRYIVGFGLVEMAFSTNPKPTI